MKPLFGKNAWARNLMSIGLLLLCSASSSFAWQSDKGDGTYANPPLYADYPDPDIIRVGEDFYFATTTFANSPGLRLLHSRDLVNWEIVGHIISPLDGRKEYNLEGGNAYKAGIYAPSLRFHDGTFYVAVTPVHQNTRIYYSTNIRGPWQFHELDRPAFDPGLFIESDGRAYIMTSGGWDGTGTLLSLNKDLSAVVSAEKAFYIKGAEGSKLVKRGDWYYLFNSIPYKLALTVSRAKALTGPWETRSQIDDTSGGHQGALVDLPDGGWYGFVMRDAGAVGRMTNISPVFWRDDWPIWGTEQSPGVVPASARKPIQGQPTMQPGTSDDFETAELGSQWEWNHNPDNALWSLKDRSGYLRLHATRAPEFWIARNTLTQKGQGPWSSGEVRIDLRNLAAGESAGFGTLGKISAFIAVERTGDGKLEAKLQVRNDRVGEEVRGQVASLDASEIYLRTEMDFVTNRGRCDYSLDGRSWANLGGSFPLLFDWRTGTFQGEQYAIFCFGAAPSGGFVDVDYFHFSDKPERSASEPSLAADKKDVTFHWFEYSGDDKAKGVQSSPTQYTNPILTGFYPDPSVCRVGDDYYLINSTFAYFPGIPIFHSRDLVNWNQIGHVISRPEQLPYSKLGTSRGIFAPSLSHHDGTFYMICTMVDAGGNFIVTAKDPAGPWSDPTWLDFEGIDPSIFFDENGRSWIVNNGAPEEEPRYDGHRAIWIQEFDSAAKKMVGPRKVLVNGGVDITKKPSWIEGPHLYKRDGFYYLCCAEGGTGGNHSQVIFRSKAVDGPYAPWSGNPILTQRNLGSDNPFPVTSTGHADLVVGPDNKWWAVFLGVRPYDGRYSPMGRETFLLPVEWTQDGWPRILEDGKRVPRVNDAPNGAAVVPTKAGLNGMVNWRDDFSAKDISQQWIMLRTPIEPWWKEDHGLKIKARPESLAGRGNPSYLARRVQHAHFSAATSLDIPGMENVSAGLALYQGEHYNYFLAVKRDGKDAVLSLEKNAGGQVEIVKSVRIQPTTTLKLRASADDAVCDFSYSKENGEWIDFVKNADAKILTTDVAGGFVGATVGMFARDDSGQK